MVSCDTFEIAPEDFGLKPASAAGFLDRRRERGDRSCCGARWREIRVPRRMSLALNAGAAIYVGGGAASLAEGVEMARKILASGRALETIEKMRRASLANRWRRAESGVTRWLRFSMRFSPPSATSFAHSA